MLRKNSIKEASLPKNGKRPLIGLQSTNGSGLSFQQKFVGEERVTKPQETLRGRLSNSRLGGEIS